MTIKVWPFTGQKEDRTFDDVRNNFKAKYYSEQKRELRMNAKTLCYLQENGLYDSKCGYYPQ
jgi:hypothetical protein